ncbi:MAG: hypothetical protein QOE59_5159 [Actinomycetota bacterium]|nr:hypothetical protein [Actinomycetota bacterium]
MPARACGAGADGAVLNELQGFLGPNGTGLSRRLLDELHATAGDVPLVVVATVWPDKLRNATAGGAEDNRDIRELLAEPSSYVRRHDVAARLSVVERTRVGQVLEAHPDPRMRRALDDPVFGFTQALAGAGELLEFYRDPGRGPGVALVLDAAADYRRLGGQAALPRKLLTAMARALWDDSHGDEAPDPGLFDWAVTTAAGRLRDDLAGVRALIPLASGGYGLADYLEAHLTSARRHCPVSDSVWDALRDHAPTGDLLHVATAASRHARVGIEGQVCRRAAAAAEPGAHVRLAFWLQLRGRPAAEVEGVIREGTAAGDPGARRLLIDWLKNQSRPAAEVEQAIRDAATAGDDWAHCRLAEWLASQDRPAAEVEQAHREA